jgi:hypothetical protein
MRLPENCRSGLCFPFMSPDISHSHITQPPVSQQPRHYLVTPVMFLVLVCVQNSCGHHGPCLQSSFICFVKKFWSLSSFTDLESCHHPPNLRAAAVRQQDTSPCGRAGVPLPRWNVKSRTSPKLLELKTLLCWKQTHKRQNLDKAVSLDQERANMCPLQLSKHASTKWLTVDPPYIPDTVVPAPHLGFVQVKG